MSPSETKGAAQPEACRTTPETMPAALPSMIRVVKHGYARRAAAAAGPRSR